MTFLGYYVMIAVMERQDERIKTLDHMVDERFAEIFFVAKEEYEIDSNSDKEKELYNLLDKHKRELREFGAGLFRGKQY